MHVINANTWSEYAPAWSQDSRGGTSYFVKLLWHDKRVKAGLGNYKFMFAHNTDPMADGTWMNLVF